MGLWSRMKKKLEQLLLSYGIIEIHHLALISASASSRLLERRSWVSSLELIMASILAILVLLGPETSWSQESARAAVVPDTWSVEQAIIFKFEKINASITTKTWYQIR